MFGVIAALLVVAAVAGGLYALNRSRKAAAGLDAASRVVVVFALPAEDGAVTAQLIVVVDPKATPAAYKVVDASSTVTLPGTSYSTLRDAYPFGGAAAVATAMDGGVLKPDTAWVEVTPAAWAKLVQAGVEVTITENFDTFDGTRFTEFPAGPQRVAAADLGSLVNGLAYQSKQERDAVFATLAAQSLKALASGGATRPAGVTTNLSPKGWQALLTALQ